MIQLSEEAQERINILNITESMTRKNSKLNTNEDLIYYLLVSFDPYISSLRKLHKKKIQDFSNEIQSLLLFSN